MKVKLREKGAPLYVPLMETVYVVFGDSGDVGYATPSNAGSSLFGSLAEFSTFRVMTGPDAGVIVADVRTTVSDGFPVTDTGVPKFPEVFGGVGVSPPPAYAIPVVP